MQTVKHYHSAFPASFLSLSAKNIVCPRLLPVRKWRAVNQFPSSSALHQPLFSITEGWRRGALLTLWGSSRIKMIKSQTLVNTSHFYSRVTWGMDFWRKTFKLADGMFSIFKEAFFLTSSKTNWCAFFLFAHFFFNINSEKRLHFMNQLVDHPNSVEYFWPDHLVGRVLDDHIPFLNRGIDSK